MQTTDRNSKTDDASDLGQVAAALWPISAHPFNEVGTVGDLIEKGLSPAPWLNSCGVYAIVAPPAYDVHYLDMKLVNRASNVITPQPVDRLSTKWVPGARVVYIGLAGNTIPRSIRQQLKSLIRHASGDTTDRGPHRDGEVLWQLVDHESFMVMAMPTGDPPEPKDLEAKLLERFAKRFGTVPFGNKGKDAVAQPRTPAAAPVVRSAVVATPQAPSPIVATPTFTPPKVSAPANPVIAKALERAQSEVILEALRSTPDAATIGEFLTSLRKHGLEEAFHSLTLGDMRGSGEQEEPEESPEPTGSLDDRIAAFLETNKRLRAEEIRNEVGGTPAQVRDALKRLIAAKLVRVEGEKRATQYIWDE